MAFCPNCGNKIEEGCAFCGACGTRVAAPAAPAAPVAPVEPAAPAWAAPIENTAAPTYTAPEAPAYTAPAAPTYTAPEAPAYTAPAAPTYTAPTYTAPAAPTWNAPAQQAEVSGGDKAKGIVGMAMAIGGMALAIIGLLYVLIGLEEGDGFSFGLAIGFGIFSLPLSIVGRIMAGKSQEAGNTSGMCSTGRTLGLVGLIVSAVMFFFGFISLMY